MQYSNEWDLQDQLTLKWIRTPLHLNHVDYFLVAWELMFPSWKINDKNKKWNEVSIDFILFDGEQTFLCLELKNIIKGRKALLSAYCQVAHRTALFQAQYDTIKMGNLYQNCFDSSLSYRVRESISPSRRFNFPVIPNVIPVLAAAEIPNASLEMIAAWNVMGWETFCSERSCYTKLKEMDRLMDMNVKLEDVVIMELANMIC